MAGNFNADGTAGFDGFMFLGYFDAVTSETHSPFLGIRIQEPGSGYDGFRARLWIREADGSDVISDGIINLEMGQRKSFDLAYTANPDGSGTLSGIIDGEAISVTAPASSTTFNAFGMGAGFFNNDQFGVAFMYYDNLKYTIHPDKPLPDLNGDGFVDGNDWVLFEDCASGAEVPYAVDCDDRDFDVDGDVDQDDFAVWQRCYSGEGTPFDPNCAG